MRYLQMRSGLYRYYTPRAADAEGRSDRPEDLRAAIANRDALDDADNELWASYMGVQGVDVALVRYRMAEAMGFSYRPPAQIAKSVEEILKRFGAL